MFSGRIFFRQVCMPDDNQQLAQACIAHTVSLLQRTLPDVTWRVRRRAASGHGWRVPCCGVLSSDGAQLSNASMRA
jgi:hypothetical protein